jgi:molybdopterin molybdotransferase
VGVHDLVPEVLAEMGVREVFHKVQLKPGKPLWFGVHERDGRHGLVFGLPGNPVSSLVCYYLFVAPAIRALAGRGFVGLAAGRARLTGDFQHRGNRATYRPALVRASDAGPTVEPVRWLGSADLASLAAANALIAFPPREHAFAAGDEVTVLPFPEP